MTEHNNIYLETIRSLRQDETKALSTIKWIGGLAIGSLTVVGLGSNVLSYVNAERRMAEIEERAKTILGEAQPDGAESTPSVAGNRINAFYSIDIDRNSSIIAPVYILTLQFDFKASVIGSTPAKFYGSFNQMKGPFIDEFLNMDQVPSFFIQAWKDGQTFYQTQDQSIVIYPDRPYQYRTTIYVQNKSCRALENHINRVADYVMGSTIGSAPIISNSKSPTEVRHYNFRIAENTSIYSCKEYEDRFAEPQSPFGDDGPDGNAGGMVVE